jgi:hypothetical protein
VVKPKKLRAESANMQKKPDQLRAESANTQWGRVEVSQRPQRLSRLI